MTKPIVMGTLAWRILEFLEDEGGSWSGTLAALAGVCETRSSAASNALVRLRSFGYVKATYTPARWLDSVELTISGRVYMREARSTPTTVAKVLREVEEPVKVDKPVKAPSQRRKVAPPRPRPALPETSTVAPRYPVDLSSLPRENRRKFDPDEARERAAASIL